MFRILKHRAVVEWEGRLGLVEKRAVAASLDLLREQGPSLRRPVVGIIKGEKYANLKELRPAATNIRIIFAFDPERSAILLVAGDKTGEWQRWYDRNLPVAVERYERHLARGAAKKRRRTSKRRKR